MAEGGSNPTSGPSQGRETTQNTPAEKRDEAKENAKKARGALMEKFPQIGKDLEMLEHHTKELVKALKKLFGMDFYKLLTEKREQRDIDETLKGKVHTITSENAKKLAIDINRLPSPNNNEGTGEWMFRCLNKGETDVNKQLAGMDEVLLKPQKKTDAYFTAALEAKFILAKGYIFHKEGELSIKESATPKNGKSDFSPGDVVFSKGRDVCGFIVGRDANGLYINTGKESKKHLPFKDCVYVFHLQGNNGIIPVIRQPSERSAGSTRPAGTPSSNPSEAGSGRAGTGDRSRTTDDKSRSPQDTPGRSAESQNQKPSVTTAFNDQYGNRARLGIIGDSTAVGLRSALRSYMNKKGNESPVTGFGAGGRTSRAILDRIRDGNQSLRTDADWENVRLSPEYKRQFEKTDRLAVMAGTNGIGGNVDNNLRSTKKIIELYLRANPTGICYVFSLYPQERYWPRVIKNYNKGISEDGAKNRARAIKRNVLAYNNRLKEFAGNNPRVRVLDLYSVLGNGTDSTERRYSGDSVHLNGNVNSRIAQALYEGDNVNLS